jgi:hypothetical protein
LPDWHGSADQIVVGNGIVKSRTQITGGIAGYIAVQPVMGKVVKPSFSK